MQLDKKLVWQRNTDHLLNSQFAFDTYFHKFLTDKKNQFVVEQPPSSPCLNQQVEDI